MSFFRNNVNHIKFQCLQTFTKTVSPLTGSWFETIQCSQNEFLETFLFNRWRCWLLSGTLSCRGTNRNRKSALCFAASPEVLSFNCLLTARRSESQHPSGKRITWLSKSLLPTATTAAVWSSPGGKLYHPRSSG